MHGRVVAVVVDADHDVQHVADLHRRGDDHPLRAAVEVALQGLGREELPGALQHQFDAEVAPRDVGRHRMRREAELPFADADRRFALGCDRLAPAALHRVERQQVRGGRGATLDLVQVHDFQPVARARIVCLPLGRAEGGAQREPADASHAVDAHFHRAASIRRFDDHRNVPAGCDAGMTAQAPADPSRVGLGHVGLGRAGLGRACATPIQWIRFLSA